MRALTSSLASLALALALGWPGLALPLGPGCPVFLDVCALFGGDVCGRRGHCEATPGNCITCRCDTGWQGSSCSDVITTHATTSALLLAVIGAVVFITRGRSIWAARLRRRIAPYDDAAVTKKHDVFLSYRCGGEDETFVVTQLLPRLEAWGYSTVLHSRDFVPGKVIAENILEAVENTHRVVLVISRSFLQSEWCRFEYQAAQEEMLKMRTRIVPILMEDHRSLDIQDRNLKHILESVTYIQWSPASDDAWERLRLSMPKKKKKAEEVDTDRHAATRKHR